MAKLLFDCSRETLYPLAKEGFSGGSQVYVRALISGLVARGHEVHVIAPDLETDERRGLNEFWWPTAYHPRNYDVAVMQMHGVSDPQYDAQAVVLMTSYVNPDLGPNNIWADEFDAFPVFSKVHQDMLCALRPVKPEKCFITGLGVHLGDYPVTAKTLGRMLYLNDPTRGLFYLLDIFDLVRKEVPYATLNVTYDFDRQMGVRAWEHSQIAQYLWECKRRVEGTPGVKNMGGLSRHDIIQQQLSCQVHCMPSDPTAPGTQIHGIAQMECAAAGAALVLSDIEAFPEVFTGGATILPVVGKFIPEQQRRVTAEDYASVVIDLLTHDAALNLSSQAARKLAKRHSWDKVVNNWVAMFEKLGINMNKKKGKKS